MADPVGGNGVGRAAKTGRPGGTDGPQAVRSGARRFGVVGVGRAGAAVGAAVAAAGHEVVAVHVRSTSSALRAARVFPSARLESPAGVAELSDVVLLGLPDDTLARVAAAIAQAGAPRRGLVVAHLSGRHGLDVLEPVLAGGAARAAIHPVMTLAGTGRDAVLLRGASFGVTADPDAEAAAREVVAAAGGRYVPVPEKGRAAYHAALTLSANYAATLLAVGRDLLERAGVDDSAAVLAPLLRATLDNALAGGVAAMTGPVRRGDAGTIRDHLAALSEAGMPPAAADAYRELGLLTADYLMAAGVQDRAALAEVVALLDALR